MNKRVVIIVVIVLVVIGLAIGGWFFFNNQSAAPVATPAPLDITDYQFPSSAEKIDWDYREIFKSGLTKSAASVLEELPQGAVLHLYFSEPFGDGYLLDIVVVWLGTDEYEPEVIDPRFREYQ